YGTRLELRTKSPPVPVLRNTLQEVTDERMRTAASKDSSRRSVMATLATLTQLKRPDHSGFSHGISLQPASWFAARASTNNRSLKRFKYTTVNSPGSFPNERYSVTVRRSARRQTARATCSAAAAREPP